MRPNDVKPKFYTATGPPKKKGPRAANERARKKTDGTSLAVKLPLRKSFDFLDFMRAPDFKNFLRAFPTLSPEEPAPSEQKNTNSNATMKTEKNPHDGGINNGCGHVIAPQENKEASHGR